MANIAKVSDYIAKKTVAEIKNEAVFLNKIDSKSYKSEFDSRVNGYKVGESIKLKKGALVTVLDGFVDGTDISGKYKDIQEEEITATVNSNPIVGTNITDADATFALAKPSNESEWTERVIKPVVAGIVSAAEMTALKIFTKNADNAIVLDTAPTAYKDEFKNLNARLAANRAPAADRTALVNTDVMNILSGEVEEHFNPSADATTAFKKAKIGQYGGMDFYNDELAYIRTNGCGGNTLTLAADYVEGATSVTVTSGSGAVEGDIVEFDFKVYDSQAKIPTTKNVQRAIKEVVGNVLTISPMYFTDSELQNVGAASLVTGATATGLGVSGDTYLVNPVFQKMGFASASIKQPKLGALDKINASVDMAGVSFRIFTADDIDSGASKQRAECMSAYFAPRPEWCGRVEINTDLL